MVQLADLLLPLIITSVCVFFASSIMWMALPHHKKDIQFLKDKEAGYIKTLNELDIKPGLYMYPGCEMKDLKTEEGKARYDAGPWGVMTVYPGKPNFPLNLAKTFVTYTLITFMVGYIAGLSLPHGADYMHVFRVVGTTAILGHCMGALVGDFFMGKPTRFIMTSFFDGLVYAMITAGVLASMWPKLAQTGTDILIIP